ncbi:hypothetical protein AQJ27_44170 [Streptomyces olivochromogenes]|nr:hypothetical protein AQJ27_44170 [Streptomyces olivochromogenes]
MSDNAAMLRSAERNGFVREGVLRSSAWVLGEFLDEVLLGLLVQDWKPDSKLESKLDSKPGSKA